MMWLISATPDASWSVKFLNVDLICENVSIQRIFFVVIHEQVTNGLEMKWNFDETLEALVVSRCLLLLRKPTGFSHSSLSRIHPPEFAFSVITSRVVGFISLISFKSGWQNIFKSIEQEIWIIIVNSCCEQWIRKITVEARKMRGRREGMTEKLMSLAKFTPSSVPKAKQLKGKGKIRYWNFFCLGKSLALIWKQKLLGSLFWWFLQNREGSRLCK